MERVALKYMFLFSLIHYEIMALSLCPSGCRCDDERLLVHCQEGYNLEILPITLNPATERLIIKFNSIKIIDSSIQFYSELRMLELSNNEIYLTEDNIFIYQNKLLQLHLNNNKINDINNKTFKGLVRLEMLNLRGNFILNLKNNTFTNNPNVEYLNLGQNRITFIESEAFKGLKKLKSLYLDDNSLAAIPGFSFLFIPYLVELFIGMNSFYSLENSAFLNLKSLAVLDMNGCQFKNLSYSAFYHLTNLKSLDISNNMLKTIPTKVLSLLNRLESLKIGQNYFETIEEGSFFGLTFLRKIDISGNKELKNIQPGAFAANPSLETIIITSNKLLNNIHDGVFSGLPNIKNIDLRNNAFETIREQLLQWTLLKSFELAENPIVCDCKMKWLQLVLQTSKKNNYDIFCASPSQYYELNIKDIPKKDDFGCNVRSSLSIKVLFILAIATIFAIFIYKNRRFIEIKNQQKAKFINSDTLCNLEHNHIYEEISIKKHEHDNFNNLIKCNNNNYSYSFGNFYKQYPIFLTPTDVNNENILSSYLTYD